MAARGVDLTKDLEQLATLESQRRRVIPHSKDSSANRTPPATKSHASSGRVRMRVRSSKPTRSAHSASSRWKSSSTRSNINARACWRRSQTCRTRACPSVTGAAENVVVRTWGEPRVFDFEVEGPLGSRDAAWHHRLRTRDEDRGRALCGADGRRRATRTRAHQLHAPTAHDRARLRADLRGSRQPPTAHPPGVLPLQP